MKKTTVLATLVLLASFGWAQMPDTPPPDQAPQTGQGPGGMGRGHRGPGIGGTITAINGNSITIKTMDGNTAEVNVTDQTRFRKDRQEAKLSDLKVGDMIMVYGQQSNGVWQAEMVGVPPAGFGGNMREGLGKRFIAGEIKSINGTQLEIARPDGVTQTISVDENTSFKKDNQSITLSDLKAGDHIFGRGEMKNDVFVAAELNSGQPRFGRHAGPAGGGPQQPQQ